MKNKVNKYIDEHCNDIIELGATLFKNPELGFKEFKTKQLILDELNKHNITINKEYFETGFEVKLGNGKGPTIGLIAELDAIIVDGHPNMDKETKAAHACGHSLQSTIACGVIEALNASGILNELNGTLKVFFTPAEEFCDVDYRANLIKEGKLKAYSGKENMLLENVFDDCDIILSTHVMGESQYHYSINSTLAGFCYKKITFIGKAAHAAVIPHLGVNALNMFTLFQSAVGMLRETFVDEDKVRIHGMLTKGGESVNSIPQEVVYECYIRSVNNETIMALNKQLDITATSCAAALNGSVKIENLPGYLPLIQSKAVNDVIKNNVLNYCDDSKIYYNEISMAAGDVGDISLFKPTIQLGFGGTRGRVHGTTFEVYDNEKAYLEPIKVICGTIIDLLSNPTLVKEIVDCYQPSMTYEEYAEYLKY